MINNDIKKLLKEAHTAAEDLRIALDKQPEHIALAAVSYTHLTLPTKRIV